jgi:hypothetical protein
MEKQTAPVQVYRWTCGLGHQHEVPITAAIQQMMPGGQLGCPDQKITVAFQFVKPHDYDLQVITKTHGSVE